MFGSIVRKFAKSAYISVIKDGDTCDVCVRILKGKREIQKDSKRFNIDTRESSKLLYEFIGHILSKYNIFYNATIINSINQGGVPGCDKRNFQKYEIDTTNASVVCIDKKWSIFASNYDLEGTKKEYEDIGGLDFIFSPLVVLKNFLKQDTEEQVSLCILKQKTSATIGIFDKNSLLYSSYIILKNEQQEEEESKKKEEDIFSGESSDFEEEKLVDLDDIALELKEDSFETLSEDGGMPGSADISEASIESLGSDLKILEFVKTSLTQFYKHPMYESSNFVEKIIVADPYFETKDIKNLLENELLLPVIHKQISLCEVVSSMAIEEVLY
ncbi:MAG: hypothetical protein PHE67_09850 [Campylobacterales bacterium]|nr:hypothetical protein [Campylobacterales bacterium]